MIGSFKMTNDRGSGQRIREMKNSDTDDDVDNGIHFTEEVSSFRVLPAGQESSSPLLRFGCLVRG